MLDKTKFYIDGRWVAPIDGTDFPVINPATEVAFATISLGGQKDAEAAIAAAKADKIKTHEQEALLQQVRGALSKHPAAYPELILTSSEKGMGIETLRATIAGLI